MSKSQKLEAARESVCDMRTRVEVRESALHGRGVFAKQPLIEGQWIGRFEGTPTKRDGTYVLWVVDDDGTEVGILGCNDLRFLNHGAVANAEFDAADLYALRDVDAGTELLIDYGADWAEEFDPPE